MAKWRSKNELMAEVERVVKWGELESIFYPLLLEVLIDIRDELQQARQKQYRGLEVHS